MKKAIDTTRQQVLGPKFYKRLIEPLRAQARSLGYAIAVHGSLKRDIDLIAIPWTEDAADPRQLADGLYAVTAMVMGFVPPRSYSLKGCDHTLAGMPGMKPHGRLGWVWQLGGGVYIDLSVMPRKDAEPPF